MSAEEVRGFLAEKLVMQCATNGPRGLPHVVPLWFLPADPLRSWTYRKSQKGRNLERDPRATLGLEDGVLYHELRGLMLECDVELEHDPAQVERFGLELFERYSPEVTPETRTMIGQQAPKRVVLTFRPTRTVSWDHRKLHGSY